MEPLPLIPRIQNTITPDMGCLVREVFQDALQAEAAAWRISINLSKSCRQNPDLRQIAAQIQAEIINHNETLNDLEYAEIRIMESRGYHLCRDQRMTSSERAMEIIRLKRHPLYIDLHPNIIEKYPLLQSDDLLPPMHERATDFRLNNRDRIRMKKRLYRSRDSLIDEISPSTVASRVCRFDTITEQRSRKLRNEDRSSMMQQATHKRSIIRSEYFKTVLVAEPEELFFHNFEYNKMYKKTVLIKNVSNSMARYKIERRSLNSKFTILFDTALVETLKIAPGMHIKLTVLFLCDVIDDPEEFLIVNVQSAKTVCVKMRGFRDPPLLRAVSPLHQACSGSINMEMENSSSSYLSIFDAEGEVGIGEEQPTGTREQHSKDKLSARCNVNLGANFECGTCFVGERITVPTKFVNDGGDGRFFIMSEIDWCSMNIDDIMDCNMIIIPPFAMWPIYFTLRSGECIEIHTYFYPISYGMQVDKLYILCDNHAIHPIELIGDGILYDPNFVYFGDNIQKKWSPENDDESFANYPLYMGDVGSDETLEHSILVTNTSELDMYYRWEKESVKYSTSSPNSTWAQLPIENLEIQPAKGSLNRNSITSFRVIALSNDLLPTEYRAILRLYIEDIPFAAIPKDCDLRITACRAKRRNCSNTVDVLVADIEVWLNCADAKIPSHPIMSEETEYETRCLNEAGEINNLKESYLSSSSTIAIQNLYSESWKMVDDPLTCGMENAQCNNDYKGIENSVILESASLGMTENLDSDIVAPAVPRLEFHYQTTNTAILIPDKPLYIGIEQTYTLMLRNLICKPVSYAWGQPLDKDAWKMRICFNPDKGLIPPTDTAEIQVICLPMTTGMLNSFFIPCFIGGRQDPIMLGIECTVDSLYVTFIFQPASNIILSPCGNSIRVEWHKDGNKSALNLNNLKMSRISKTEEEEELKNIDLDAGHVVATAAVGPISVGAENVSLFPLPEISSAVDEELPKIVPNKVRNKSVKTTNLKDNAIDESEQENVVSSELRSWESLLEGIIWTENRPDEFVPLTKPQALMPFHKTIVPPITQSLAIEFVDLPLRTVEKRTFVIRNETPAESRFVITLKQFGPVKSAKELSPTDTIDRVYACVMGHESENYWDDIKPPEKGVIVVIEPMAGNLAPYETVPVDVYVYADTWGVYVDEIAVAIVGLPDYVFGVCIQVVGSPIAYPLCKNGIQKKPVLRFGTLGLGAESVTRKILIENTSCVVLVINWYNYLVDSVATENSIPFNINLQMFTPFINKVADIISIRSTNALNVQKTSTADYTTEESQLSRLNSDNWDSSKNSTIIQMNSSLSNCYRSETQSPTSQTSASNISWHRCCSESHLSSNRIPPQNKEQKAEDSIEKYNLDEREEYTTESKIQSVSRSKQTIEKETDLELTLTPYYGEPDYSMFTVVPAELIIPVKGKRSIEITLNVANDKFSMQNARNEVLSRLMGFIRIAPMHKYKADCYSRDDGTMLAPTEIQLEATITQPMLSHEITKSDRTFEIFASSVLTHFQKQIEIHRKYVFSNNEGEPMFVNVQSMDPFQVLSLTTPKSIINPRESDGISVHPGQCIEVNLLCSVDASWIDKAMEMGRYESTENSYADITKSLLINHTGSCIQAVPLRLRIHSPLLKLSTHELKFGTVYIGDLKRIDLTIENLSSEKQTVNIKTQKNNKDFTVSPSQGILSHRDSTLEVVVTFTALEPNKSVEVLEISTAVPDYIEECVMEGYGTWDEIYNDPGE